MPATAVWSSIRNGIRLVKLNRGIHVSANRCQQLPSSTKPVVQQKPQKTKKPESEFQKKVGKDFIRIWTSYFIITVVGITVFYNAKKEVDQSRKNAMLLKKEIFQNENTEKYPSRREMVEAEKLKRT
jgi:hypothetical protein